MIEHGKAYPHKDLGRLAREARLDAGLSQTEVARRLSVSQATIAQAEGDPERNLTRLRLQMISEFSAGHECVGPYWLGKRKADKIKDRDVFM